MNVLYRAHYYKNRDAASGGLSCRFQIGDEAPAQSRDLRPPQHMRSVASMVCENTRATVRLKQSFLLYCRIRVFFVRAPVTPGRPCTYVRLVPAGYCLESGRYEGKGPTVSGIFSVSQRLFECNQNFF